LTVQRTIMGKIKINEKTRFLFKNLLKGLAWLAILLLLFFFVKNNVDIEVYEKYSKYLDNETRVYTIYTFSEIFFGIFPPELFMIWALERSDLNTYITIIGILAFISYSSGWIAYLFGRYLNGTLIYRFVRRKFLRKYERLFNNYGLYLIVVAATTPVPFSAVCMLVGSVKYPFNKFFYYSLFRFLRFAAYSFIVWETVQL